MSRDSDIRRRCNDGTDRGELAQPGGSSGSTLLERRTLRAVLQAMSVDWLRVELWDGAMACPGAPGSPTLHINSRRALLNILRNPNIGFGDGYSDGTVQLDGDLPEFLVRLFHSLRRPGNRVLRGLWDFLAGRPRLNTLDRAVENIQSHYDLGNDFYALWLDERMVYTCAYYPRTDASLDEAQVAKLDHVCRKLALEPGQRILELGCGWGALALHMAERYGTHVTAYNISHQQIGYARERAAKMGLSQAVHFVEDDYRAAEGTFDRVVSVGMLEHVGVENYPEFGAVFDRCLSKEGLGLVHSIGRSARRRMDPWAEKRIFPGAYPPTLSEMEDVFAPSGMVILDVENLRLHYAKTCRDWRERYEAYFDAVSLRFDPRFARAWYLYLAGSEAAFLTGFLQLFQVLFTRRENNRLPWTRAYMYPPSTPDAPSVAATPPR